LLVNKRENTLQTLKDKKMILPDQSALFDIPAHVTYMNCASASPLLKSVQEAGVRGMNMKRDPWLLNTEDWFNPAEELRTLFAKIIQGDKENIALIPAASYGIATAANNIQLSPEQHILVLDQQYPSNVYAWRELSKRSGAAIITVEKQVGQTWTAAILDKVNTYTGLVAIPNCHWTDGSLIDLEQVSQAVKKAGAKLVIDASQSLGAYPLDINKIKPDFLITAGYKWLLGAYGTGFLYAAPQYCETGKPIEYSWLNRKGSDDFTALVNYQEEYRAGARRFDVGEFPSFIHVQMGIAALTQVLDWGVANIQETLAALTGVIEEKARARGLETPDRSDRVGHMIGIRLTDSQAASLKSKLADNQVHVSFRGKSMRIAPYLYNNLQDVEQLFQFL
jgi:selenocysteine lyase/cysteine desulfurase